MIKFVLVVLSNEAEAQELVLTSFPQSRRITVQEKWPVVCLALGPDRG